MPLGKLLMADTACKQLLVQLKQAAAMAMSVSSLLVPLVAVAIPDVDGS